MFKEIATAFFLAMCWNQIAAHPLAESYANVNLDSKLLSKVVQVVEQPTIALTKIAAPISLSKYGQSIALSKYEQPILTKIEQPIALTKIEPEIKVDYIAYPRYGFKYGVEDLKTGDRKEQVEERDGDVVKGQYSLAEPDGTIRTVKYVADKHNGFNAEVIRSGHAVHPQTVQLQKVITVAAPLKTIALDDGRLDGLDKLKLY